MIYPNWLKLPASLSYEFIDPSLQYGANYVAAKYCKLLSVPQSISGRWEHGWVAPYQMVEPLMATCMPATSATNTTFFVATQEIEELLIAYGYKAKAIGLPIAYTKAKPLSRKAGSLLVMPQHSLHDVPLSHPFQLYVEEINKIRHNYSDVVVCLHSSCIDNKFWVQEFRSAGYYVIEGANQRNRHSLQRMRDLFSQFEYITTNGYSSLIPYACAFGAKVFLYGTYCETTLNDLLQNAYYQENPFHASVSAWLCSEAMFKAHYPHFFCDPFDSKSLTKWGMSQIGVNNKIKPIEMRQLFGEAWGIKFNIKARLKNILFSV